MSLALRFLGKWVFQTSWASVMVIDLFKTSISSCSNFGILWFARHLSVLSSFSNMLDIWLFVIFIWLEHFFLMSVIIFFFVVVVILYFICNLLFAIFSPFQVCGEF